MRCAALVGYLLFVCAASAGEVDGLGVGIAAVFREPDGLDPQIIQTLPEDGSAVTTPTPVLRAVFNTDMDSRKNEIQYVVLPAGLTPTELVWIDARTLEIRYDGFLRTFGAKRVDLLDTYFRSVGRKFLPPGAGWAFTFADPNTPPFIILGPTADPSTAAAGQEVKFSVNAFDPNGDPLTYSWTFGDGTTDTGQSPAHTYTKEGPFIATVTVSDDKGGSVMGSVLVGAAARSFWTVTKTQIMLSFAKPGRDRATVAGIVELPAGFDPLNLKTLVDIGGASQSFTLNKRGQGKTGKDVFRLTRKLKKKQFLGGAVKITFTIKGTLAPTLADDGFANTTTAKTGTNVPVKILLVLGGKPYEALVDTLYKSKQGKNGRAVRRTVVK